MLSLGDDNCLNRSSRILFIFTATVSISSKMMKWSVFCHESILFCVTYWNIAICANSKETHKSWVCFQHAKHDQTFYLIWYLHVESKHRTCASLCYLYNIAIFKYVTQNSTFTRQNTLHFIILELIPMCTCIYWYRKHMFV